MTSSTITIVASDGHRLEAYQVIPAGKPRGGLVIVQTAFGISHYLRDVCAYYAAQGYAAIAPALYDRQRRQAVFDHSPESAAETNRLRQGLQWDSALADVAAARDAVVEYGPTGVVGYCVGGSIAWLAAHEQAFAAVVSYYGKDIVDFLNRKPACPIILHF
ncbi:MAG: dienelactone hydrolase family protein, partial [Alphaproteobacteria bacterium]